VEKLRTSSASASLEKPDTYSVPEAGRRVGLGKNASYEAARRRELPTLRFGRKLRVPRIAFEQMLADAQFQFTATPKKGGQ
jgi:excisionase family DNA binding protein